MKKLQNNFTTPEQSKRLLELGVPADSADCYFGSYLGHPDWAVIRQSEFDTEDDALFRLNEDITPCWSVGRLIEIGLRCSTLEQRQVLFFCNGDDDYYDFMAYTINVLESGIMTNQIDFSKLEE